MSTEMSTLSLMQPMIPTNNFCRFTNIIHTICIWLTLGEIFTHRAIQYFWVFAVPSWIINRSLRGQRSLITVVTSKSDTQPYCWWNINETGGDFPTLSRSHWSFSQGLYHTNESVDAVNKQRSYTILSILIGDISLVSRQPKISDEMKTSVSSGGRFFSISCQRSPLSHPSQHFSAGICNL